MQTKTEQKRKNKNPLIIIICVLLLVAAAAVFSFFGPDLSEIEEFASSAYRRAGHSLGLVNDYGENGIAVHYLYVGQGDCEIVICDGHAMLIDSGEAGNENKIIDYLHTCGISELDYAVATHPHSDHIGSMPAVLENINTKNILMTSLPYELIPSSWCYSSLLSVISESKINFIEARAGLMFNLGGASVTVIAPAVYGSDLNNTSIILRVDYKGGSYIFQGDAELEEEDSVLGTGVDIDCDVIKIGHHGASTSSGEKYLKAVSPKIAVISCGKNNEFGHPHDSTVKRIKFYTYRIYRTDLLSDITVVFDGKEYKIYYGDNK
ncbi:MAG: MBL fold metallo-hydrolase [Clostridia bacterium]|nr:MBL fold metallo-hydrolase [Clostridia bacterium]